MHPVSVPNEKPQRYVLIVDAEKQIGHIIARVASEFDLIPVRVHCAAMLRPALQLYGDQLCCAIVGSLYPAMDAVEGARYIQNELPDLPVIVMSSLPPTLTYGFGNDYLDLFAFIPKPFRLEYLRSLFSRIRQSVRSDFLMSLAS